MSLTDLRIVESSDIQLPGVADTAKSRDVQAVTPSLDTTDAGDIAVADTADSLVSKLAEVAISTVAVVVSNSSQENCSGHRERFTNSGVTGTGTDYYHCDRGNNSESTVSTPDIATVRNNYKLASPTSSEDTTLVNQFFVNIPVGGYPGNCEITVKSGISANEENRLNNEINETDIKSVSTLNEEMDGIAGNTGNKWLRLESFRWTRSFSDNFRSMRTSTVNRMWRRSRQRKLAG